MSYFDGIKVGDTVYLWDKPCVVDRVEGDLFQNEEKGWFTKDGYFHYFEHLGQLIFWQPVIPPVPPPRPKRKVKKEGWVHVYRSSFHKWTGAIYDTVEEAMEGKSSDNSYVTTVKLEWEEDEP